MELGGFSISLNVKDIEKSKVFYEKIGCQIYAGDQSQNYLIMKNGSSNIGLFQGMLEGSIMTFNPGWDQDANKVQPFRDVRDLYRHFKSQGIEVVQESIAGNSGPSSFSIVNPDGNAISVDQHV